MSPCVILPKKPFFHVLSPWPGIPNMQHNTDVLHLSENDLPLSLYLYICFILCAFPITHFYILYQTSQLLNFNYTLNCSKSVPTHLSFFLGKHLYFLSIWCFNLSHCYYGYCSYNLLSLFLNPLILSELSHILSIFTSQTLPLSPPITPLNKSKSLHAAATEVSCLTANEVQLRLNLQPLLQFPPHRAATAQ